MLPDLSHPGFHARVSWEVPLVVFLTVPGPPWQAFSVIAQGWALSPRGCPVCPAPDWSCWSAVPGLMYFVSLYLAQEQAQSQLLSESLTANQGTFGRVPGTLQVPACPMLSEGCCAR